MFFDKFHIILGKLFDSISLNMAESNENKTKSAKSKKTEKSKKRRSINCTTPSINPVFTNITLKQDLKIKFNKKAAFDAGQSLLQ